MKRTLIAALMLCLPMTLWAQFSEPPPPPEMPEPPPPGRMFRKEPSVDQWLEHLRRKKPEEYEKLQQLRKEDPEAFQEELQKRLRDRHVMARLKGSPRLMEFLKNLPPAEREEIIQQLARADREGPPPFPGLQSPDQRIKPLEDDLRRLGDEYRAATDPATQERLRGEIKNTLEQLFDLREEHREQMIAAAEGHLAGLKKQLEKRRANRERIIEKRLEEILEGDPLEW